MKDATQTIGGIISLFFLSTILLGCKEAASKKEVYQSEKLLITQISAHVYEHISYLETESFGKVPCNGMIVCNKNEAVVFDTPTDNESSSELIDWITSTLKCKIKAIIPTHYHIDNLGGLDKFHSQGIPSYAYQKTIQIAKKDGLPVPQQGFDPFLELEVGGERVMWIFWGKDILVIMLSDISSWKILCLAAALSKRLGLEKETLRKRILTNGLKQ
jgi:metallo-beta-lactamase class B